MPSDPVLDLYRPPDLAQVLDAAGEVLPGEVRVSVGSDGVAVVLSCDVPVARVRLRWRCDLRGLRRVLGDAWERAYGDLGWASVAPERLLPWTFVALTTTGRSVGVGVRVGPKAFCGWSVDDA